MATTHWTDAPADAPLRQLPSSARFTDSEWRDLLNEDNVALSSISLLLAAIIGLGMLGMAVVVGILAFGG
ncbi:MAG TPA: hypothetical protein PK867_21645 [Pirellulales bacterium]|nr:hypothetical protein [Pirellulales bacterium]